MRKFGFGLSAFAITALLGCWNGAATAADTVTLRVGDSFPNSHYVVGLIHKWMDDVSRRADGHVKFEYYGSEQLGKARDMLDLTLSGVSDISYVAPSYVTEKLPMSSIGELPGEFSDSCTGTRAYWQIARPGGILSKRELEPKGIRLLFSVLGAPYQITARKKFATPAEIAGFKLRSYGAQQDRAVGLIGGVPIRMAAPSMYESMSRGTLDGLMLPLASVLSYDLQDLVRFATTNENFGTVAFNYVISERKFQSLPADVQSALMAAGDASVEEACKFIDEDTKIAIDKLKAAGVTFVDFNREQDAKVKADLLTIAPIWATDLDKRGMPGTEIFNAFRSAIKSEH
jgi:TRAP-type C4-dicarboxylate transport system substrate-binding protein